MITCDKPRLNLNYIDLCYPLLSISQLKFLINIFLKDRVRDIDTIVGNVSIDSKSFGSIN